MWESGKVERRLHSESDGTVRGGVFSYEDSIQYHYLQGIHWHFM